MLSRVDEVGARWRPSGHFTGCRSALIRLRLARLPVHRAAGFFEDPNEEALQHGVGNELAALAGRSLADG